MKQPRSQHSGNEKKVRPLVLVSPGTDPSYLQSKFPTLKLGTTIHCLYLYVLSGFHTTAKK